MIRRVGVGLGLAVTPRYIKLNFVVRRGQRLSPFLEVRGPSPRFRPFAAQHNFGPYILNDLHASARPLANCHAAGPRPIAER